MSSRRIALRMLVCCLGATAAGLAETDPGKVDRWVLERSFAGSVEFLVMLREQGDLRGARSIAAKSERGAFVSDTLRAVAERSQQPLVALLRERGVPHRSYWIANMVWARGDRNLADPARARLRPSRCRHPAEQLLSGRRRKRRKVGGGRRVCVEGGLEIARERQSIEDRLPLYERTDTHNMLAWNHSALGNIAQVLESVDPILSDLAPNQAQALALSLSAWKVWALALLGRWDEVPSAAERFARLWEDSGQISAGYALHGAMAELERFETDPPKYRPGAAGPADETALPSGTDPYVVKELRSLRRELLSELRALQLEVATLRNTAGGAA